jgi:hypothetical protein
MQVEPAYLQASMASVTAQDGTIERYLERHLGIDPQRADRIRRRLVQPRPMCRPRPLASLMARGR